MEFPNFSNILNDKIKKLDLIYERQEEILNVLRNKSLLEPSEHLTVKEFIARTKMGRSKFERLRAEGKLITKKLGRIIYVPATEVKRYFNGELE